MNKKPLYLLSQTGSFHEKGISLPVNRAENPFLTREKQDRAINSWSPGKQSVPWKVPDRDPGVGKCI